MRFKFQPGYVLLLSVLMLSFSPLCFPAEEGDASLLTVNRIFGSDEFEAKEYDARWLEDGSAFTSLETSKAFPDRHDIVRHDPATGTSEIMVAAEELIPSKQTTPLEIDDYSWSKDLGRLLIYTNSKRVWRQKTRGDYWVLDLSDRKLRKLGGKARPASLMFAKFSPSGEYVAFVRDRDIYIEDLYDHSIRRLTHAENADVINGTADWVYEEEFGLRDGFRWSLDGSSIAYWQINTEAVRKFPLVNNIDSLYPEVTWFAYPKVGQRNPVCRIGVVDCSTAETRWIGLPGDSSDHYVARMDWAKNSKELIIQQLNRLQNRNRLFLAQVDSGKVTPILTEEDTAWVDVNDELFWLEDGERFTWISERDGWRHVYLVSRFGGELTTVTRGDFDVIRLLHVAEEAGWLYFIASPTDPSQRYLFRVRLNGLDLQRVTPEGLSGTNEYQISANARWAIHRMSSSGKPPVSDLISLPDHSRRQVLEANETLVHRLEKLKRLPIEFFRVGIGEGIELDGWCIKPPDFRPEGSYPLLIYVYGEPAGQTVVDRWGGDRYLWHLMLAQHGYLVMSFDNRGTRAPRGRAWRKSIYRKIGILPPKDQAAAVRTILAERPYIDQNRVGIWGWSGGGSSSLHAIFKYPKLYATAIAIAPVPDQRYYDTIYQERYMGLPEANVEGYRNGSPINYAKHLEGNLLLIHGSADDNCHYQTTAMLIDELISHNKQFSLMVYPNRTHSIRERKNTSRHLRDLMTRFLFQNLPVDPDSPIPRANRK